jgi:hypothetical protein
MVLIKWYSDLGDKLKECERKYTDVYPTDAAL